jgi:hypothetical protein
MSIKKNHSSKDAIPIFSCYSHHSVHIDTDRTKLDEESDSRVHEGIIKTLVDPPQLNNRKVLKLLAIMMPLTAIDPLSIDMDHFPQNWQTYKNLEQISWFYRSCFADETKNSIAHEVLSLPESADDYVKDFKENSHKIIFFLSTSNWSSVYACFKSSYTLWIQGFMVNQNNADSKIDWAYHFGFVAGFQYCNLNGQRLATILNG